MLVELVENRDWPWYQGQAGSSLRGSGVGIVMCGLCLNKEEMPYQEGAVGPSPRQGLPEGKAGPACCPSFNLKMPEIYQF